MTERINLLEIPEDRSTATVVKHKLAKLLTRPEAFPVYPDAEKSTHPMWKAYGELSKVLRMDPKPTIVKVFTIEETRWMEFADTYSPNDEFEGFVGEVERSDGWTGRYSIEFDLSQAMAYLLEDATGYLGDATAILSED